MELQLIQSRIFTVHGHRVMLDFHLAELYEVETRALKQAVKRNINRFPADFMFQISKQEWNELITICDNLPENIKHSPITPSAFTEQGVAMLSGILNSEKAIGVNIAIMRAFVATRQYLTDNNVLKNKLEELEKNMNLKFDDVYQAINYLLSPQGQRRIVKGYRNN
jgi:ORF6N domain